MAKKWVYSFGEVAEAEKYAGNWEGVRALLGGKGSGLADMTSCGSSCAAWFDCDNGSMQRIPQEQRFP